MSLASDCRPCCADPVIVQTPGAPGAIGPQGPAGEPGPSSLDDFSVYGSGTVYSLTVTAALLNLGTNPPTLQLGDAGTYLIMARARFDLNGATFGSVRTLTAKLYNSTTAADIANSSSTQKIPIVTTLTYTLPQYEKTVIYEAASDGETIQLWGSLSNLPSAGSVDCAEADIVAVKIA